MRRFIPKKLLKSKKGGIPALNEIIITFFNIIPRPIQLFLFILFLSLIASFIVPLFLNFFGYQCVDKGDTTVLLQIPFRQNFVVSFTGFNNLISTALGDPVIALPDDPFPFGDKRFTFIPSECIIKQELNGTTVNGYVSACVDCIPATDSFLDNWITPLDKLICSNDGYNPRENIGLSYRNLCTACLPPTGYFYNHTFCIENDFCYFMIHPNVTIDQISDTYLNDERYEKLMLLGGREISQNDEDFANIQCDGNNKPGLYFFSMPIFSSELWIVLLLGNFLITFAFSWYGHFL